MGQRTKMIRVQSPNSIRVLCRASNVVAFRSFAGSIFLQILVDRALGPLHVERLQVQLLTAAVLPARTGRWR